MPRTKRVTSYNIRSGVTRQSSSPSPPPPRASSSFSSSISPRDSRASGRVATRQAFVIHSSVDPKDSDPSDAGKDTGFEKERGFGCAGETRLPARAGERVRRATPSSVSLAGVASLAISNATPRAHLDGDRTVGFLRCPDVNDDLCTIRSQVGLLV